LSPRSKAVPRSTLKIQIDGAARGNPGPAGVGVVLLDAAGRLVKEIALYLGEATNNVAETCALIVALQEAGRIGSRKVAVFTDSELLARQITGEYRVKDAQLQWLHALLKHLVPGFERFEIRHVPREQNRKADRLANRAITEYLKRHPRPAPSRSASPSPDPRQQILFR